MMEIPLQQIAHNEIEAPPSRHIVALDGLRGLAVIMVLGEHLGGGRHSTLLVVRMVANTLRFGWAGVTLFFVLSGFLITGILWDSFSRQGWWHRFYLRRFLRIFPLYYLALAYSFVLALFVAHPALHAFPVYVFYLQDFPWFNKWTGLVPQNWFVLSHFWSLAVEEQFYLLWPFLLYAMRKRRSVAMWFATLCIVASLLLRLFLLSHNPDLLWPYNAAPCRAGELLIGGWIALALRGPNSNQVKLIQFAPIVLGVAVLACVAITIRTGGSFETITPEWLGWGLLVVPMLFGSLLIVCLRPGIFRRLFETRILCWYGKISYGVYVFHVLLSPIFVRLSDAVSRQLSLNPTFRDLLQSFTVLVSSTIIAWLSFHTIETYFLSLKANLSSNT